MFPRARIALGLTFLMALVFAVPAFAGGWAVISLDELPANVVAGEPLTIGFTVLQHGHSPMDGLAPTVTAFHKDTRFIAEAEPGSKPGHYTATLTFPREGEWMWSIQAFSMDQPMPRLHVAAPGAVATASQPLQDEAVMATVPPLVILRVLAFGIALVGLVLVYQRRSRLALVLTLAGIAVGLASFVLGSAVPQVEAQKLSREPSLSKVEMGQQLFVAKGCITCHVNNRVERASSYWTVDMGAPNLSNYSSAPEILFIRLKDPAAAKSDTKMPNLGLKETEIEALIAFINSK
ncbi:MAG: cytochrome c [Chloroflexota bacterium]|nr:cytochrome c [Chloroflexota bacterium]